MRIEKEVICGDRRIVIIVEDETVNASRPEQCRELADLLVMIDAMSADRWVVASKENGYEQA